MRIAIRQGSAGDVGLLHSSGRRWHLMGRLLRGGERAFEVATRQGRVGDVGLCHGGGCRRHLVGQRLLGDRAGDVWSAVVSGLAGAATATRFGFGSGKGGTTAGVATFTAVFACLLLFAATDLPCDLLACDLACVFAASNPGAGSSGTSNAQNTKSGTVAFVRFILVDRSGFAIPRT